ncbi:MAG: PAS domain-containing protein [Acidobacteriaceae bacterium]
MRSIDWAKTPLGSVDMWPQSLKTCVSICFQSRFAICICWGPEMVMLYNDAYAAIAGNKHPQALGVRVRDVLPEMWDTIGPMLNGVLKTGEATWADDLQLPMQRNGYLEECYFTFSCSPIRDESSGVGGVFTPVLETTGKVIGARRLRTLRQLSAISGSQAETTTEACQAVVDVLSTNPLDLPFAAIYTFPSNSEKEPHIATFCAGSVAGRDSTVFPREIDLHSGHWSSLRDVLRGERCILDLAGDLLIPLPEAAWDMPPVQGIGIPISLGKNSRRVGFLLAGVNIRKRLDEEYLNFFTQVSDELSGALREAQALERERALRAEAELERSKFRKLFIKAPAAIAILSGPGHRYTLANQSYLRLVGRQPEDLIDRGVGEIFPELRDQGILGILDEVYNTGIPFVANELPVKLDISKSGQPSDVFYNFVYQPTRDASGDVDGIFVLAVDATENVVARRAIETREEQFRLLANSIPQLVWIADADGGITWFNRRWYDYTGTTREQMKGWGWQSVHHPDYLPAVLAGYRKSLASGEPFEMLFPLRGADGTFHTFLSLAVPVRDSGGGVVSWFGTNTDVETQQRSEAALRQSEKLAVVGRLASSIAHEINNPLEAVTNLLYLAQAGAVNEDTRLYLRMAQQELDRVAQITSQTLRFHRESSAPGPADVAELVDSVLTLHRSKVAAGGIELKLEKQPCPPLICQAGEIRQVLANLIGNALDAMSRGGILRLRLRPSTDWHSGRLGVRITVADTGHGMPPEVSKRMYEAFYTTKGETGTGLGLWVSAGIVDKHGGSFHVRSSVRPDRSGTVFTVILPAPAVEP